MSDPRTDLPSPNSPNFALRVRETLMTYLGRQGNVLDRGVTFRDLINSGIASLPFNFINRPGVSPPLLPGPALEDKVDLTPPPTPTGFRATGAITHILVEHDEPTFPMGGGYLHTRVYGVQVNPGDPLPTFSDAVELHQFSGVIGAVPSNPATTWRLWIKWESKDGVLSASPAGGTNGLEVRTGEDVALLIEALTGNNPPQPFIFVPAPTVVNGVNVPPGTYIKDGLIQNGTITNAKIANAAIDSLKVADAAIATAKIADGAITTAKIQNAAITSAKIQDAAITTAKIQDLSVDRFKLAAQAVSVHANASGTDFCSAAVTIPPGVTGTIFAIAVTTGRSYTSSGGLSNISATLNLSLDGVTRTTYVPYNWSTAVHQSGGDGPTTTIFSSATVAISKQVSSGTYTVSGYMGGFPPGMEVNLAVFASWR